MNEGLCQCPMHTYMNTRFTFLHRTWETWLYTDQQTNELVKADRLVHLFSKVRPVLSLSHLRHFPVEWISHKRETEERNDDDCQPQDHIGWQRWWQEKDAVQQLEETKAHLARQVELRDAAYSLTVMASLQH